MNRPRVDVKFMVRRLGGKFYVVKEPGTVIVPASANRAHHESYELAHVAAQAEQSWANR